MGDEAYWKRRLPCRIYDYNYKVSEGYYKPQAKYSQTVQLLDNRRAKSPPKHQSYAERFANNPWYGGTQGLPYDQRKSAYNEPLIKLGDRHLRSSSLLREMRQAEMEDVPLSVRASRRKKKLEDEEMRVGIRPKLSSSRSVDLTAGKSFHQQIQQKIRDLDDELLRSTYTAPTSSLNNDLDRPTRSIVHRENNYNSPTYGSSMRSRFHSEISTTSKPPIIPARSRKVSAPDDFMQPRVRVNSVGDYQSTSRSSRRSSVNDEDLVNYVHRAPRFIQERKVRESRDINDDIGKMVDMMRSRKVELDPSTAYSIGRSSRASSVERTHPARRASLGSRF